jgi:hypothetical protein
MVADEYAAAKFGPLVAATMVGVERVVSIWNVETGDKLNEMETTHDMGGRRVLLSPDGEFCVTAGYEGGGLACYSVRDGQRIWHRRELKRIQELVLGRGGKGILCMFEGRPTQKVDAQTGQSLDTYKGVKKRVESPFSPMYYCERKVASLRAGDGEEIAVVSTRGVLDVMFAPNELCVAEAGGAARGFGTENGRELWKCLPRQGAHFVGLGYSEAMRCFFGVEWPYQFAGAPRLVRLRPDSDPLVLKEIWRGGHAFCWSAGLFITADGQVVDLTDGHMVRRLAFGAGE